MNCHACGRGVSRAAHFCDQCGAILSREDPVNQLAYAYRLELGGRPEEAVNEYESLTTRKLPSSEMAVVRKHLGNLHFRLGHLRKAQTHLEKACGIEPGNATFWHDLGVVEYHMVNFDAAIECFRKALEQDPHLHLGYFWLGNALYHAGELDDACQAFEDLLQRYPNFTIARFHLGVLYARQGKREESEEEFRRVLHKNPQDAAARFYIASPEGTA